MPVFLLRHCRKQAIERNGGFIPFSIFSLSQTVASHKGSRFIGNEEQTANNIIRPGETKKKDSCLPFFLLMRRMRVSFPEK